jgi:hypothetical protein
MKSYFPLSKGAVAQLQVSYGLDPDGLVAIDHSLALAPEDDGEIITLGYQMRDPDALRSAISWPERRRLDWAQVLKDLIEDFESLAVRLSGMLVAQTGTPSTVLLTATVGVEAGHAGQIQVAVYEEPEFRLRLWVTSAPGDPYILDPMPPSAANNPRWAGKVERVKLLAQNYDDLMAQFVTRWTAELRRIPI